jgi:hypothetical protein
MKKLVVTAAAFAVLVLVGGCGSENAESLIKQQIQVTNDMADALDKTNDVNDPKVKAAKEKLDKLAEAWKKQPKEKQDEAVKKHGADLAAAQLRLAAKLGGAALKTLGDLGKNLGGDAKDAADKAKSLFGK